MSEQDVEWKVSTSTKCPYCNKAVPSRRARRNTPLYEDSNGEVWGERSVLIFDYERYYPGVVHKSLRKEWFEEGEEILGICDCVFKTAFEEKCRNINIPPGLAKKSFQNFKVSDYNKDACEACFEFSLSFPGESSKGVGIHGATGVGKTHLASAIIGQILMDQIKRGEECSANFYSVPKLLQELRWWRTDNEVQKERDAFDRVSDSRVIILDDLGVDRLTDQQLEHLFLIVDDRIINERHLIVTTNIHPQELGSALGERVADRLREACDWYEIKGGSNRGSIT